MTWPLHAILGWKMIFNNDSRFVSGVARFAQRPAFWICLTALALLSAVIAFVILPSRNDVLYQGKRLSQWVLDFEPKAGSAAEVKASERAEGAIRQLGKKTLPLLIDWLQLEDTSFDRTARDILRALHLRNSGPTSNRKRERAYEVLRMLGEEAKPAIPKLIKCLDSKPSPTRAHAAQLLASLGPHAQEAVPHVTRLLDDDSGFVRGQAAQALGTFGPLAASAVPKLIRMLAEYPFGARAATHALQRIGPAAVPALMAAVEDNIDNKDSRHAVRALWVLGGMGTNAQTTVPGLIEIVRRTSNTNLRRAVLEAISRLLPENDEALRDLLAKEGQSWRTLAAGSESHLLNGEMELPERPPGEVKMLPGSAELVGWSIFDGEVCIRTDRPSPAGGTVVELAPNMTPGTIAQVFPTEAGREYQLSFLLAGGRNLLVRVSCGDLHEVVSAPPNGKGYERVTRQFQAVSPLSRLSFSATESNGFGPMIDSVVIIAW